MLRQWKSYERSLFSLIDFFPNRFIWNNLQNSKQDDSRRRLQRGYGIEVYKEIKEKDRELKLIVNQKKTVYNMKISASNDQRTVRGLQIDNIVLKESQISRIWRASQQRRDNQRRRQRGTAEGKGLPRAYIRVIV